MKHSKTRSLQNFQYLLTLFILRMSKIRRDTLECYISKYRNKKVEQHYIDLNLTDARDIHAEMDLVFGFVKKRRKKLYLKCYNMYEKYIVPFNRDSKKNSNLKRKKPRKRTDSVSKNKLKKNQTDPKIGIQNEKDTKNMSEPGMGTGNMKKIEQYNSQTRRSVKFEKGTQPSTQVSNTISYNHLDKTVGSAAPKPSPKTEPEILNDYIDSMVRKLGNLSHFIKITKLSFKFVISNCRDDQKILSRQLRRNLKKMSLNVIISFISIMKLAVREKTENMINNSVFCRKTDKFWVHPDNLCCLKSRLLKFLPCFVFGRDPESIPQFDEKISSITSVYLDNADFKTYTTRLYKLQGSECIRFRWYNDNDDIIFVERKLHMDGWTGYQSKKLRFKLQEKYINGFLDGEDLWKQVVKMNPFEGKTNKKKKKNLDKKIEGLFSNEVKPNEKKKRNSDKKSTKLDHNEGKPTKKKNIHKQNEKMKSEKRKYNKKTMKNRTESETCTEEEEHWSSLFKLYTEIQRSIVRDNLRPSIRTYYKRSAFQLPEKNDIRLSLDEDLCMLQENCCGNECFDCCKDNWRRKNLKYPFTNVKSDQIIRFPYCILELKTTSDLLDASSIEDVRKEISLITEHVHKFSKFLHGTSVLYQMDIIPYWLKQMGTGIRKEKYYSSRGCHVFEDKKLKYVRDPNFFHENDETAHLLSVPNEMENINWSSQDIVSTQATDQHFKHVSENGNDSKQLGFTRESDLPRRHQGEKCTLTDKSNLNETKYQSKKYKFDQSRKYKFDESKKCEFDQPKHYKSDQPKQYKFDESKRFNLGNNYESDKYKLERMHESDANYKSTGHNQLYNSKTDAYQLYDYQSDTKRSRNNILHENDQTSQTVHDIVSESNKNKIKGKNFIQMTNYNPENPHHYHGMRKGLGYINDLDKRREYISEPVCLHCQEKTPEPKFNKEEIVECVKGGRETEQSGLELRGEDKTLHLRNKGVKKHHIHEPKEHMVHLQHGRHYHYDGKEIDPKDQHIAQIHRQRDTARTPSDTTIDQTMSITGRKPSSSETTILSSQSTKSVNLNNIKRIAIPIRVEPKVFFANERTFLSWLHFSIFIGGLGSALVGLGDTKAVISGAVFIVVSTIFAMYALYLYMWRARRIRERDPGPYDDLVGPGILVFVFVAAMALSLLFKIRLH